MTGLQSLGRLAVIREGTRPTLGSLGLLDLLAFVLPALSFLEILIIGRLIVTEVLFLVMLPWLWRVEDRPRLPPWFVVLLAGWLVSQVVTDLIVGSAFRDYARGWAGIVFTLINFAAILVLASTPRRARIFAAGLATAGFLGYLFAPHPAAAADPWKWALAIPIGLVLAAALSGPGTVKVPWLASAAFVVFGAANLLLGYRSLGGVSLVVGSYLALGATISRRNVVPGHSTRRAIIGLVFLLVAAAGVLGIYSAAASTGLLGEKAQDRYLMQDGPLGALLGGRAEILVSSQAILDSPIVGHGSWAADPRYTELLAERQAALGYEVSAEYVGTELIPAHSYLMGAWVWAGLLGGMFWLAVSAVAIWLLANLYWFRIALAPLLVFSAVLLLWDIAFSPYSFSARITAPYALALCLLGLRLIRGAEGLSAEGVPVQQRDADPVAAAAGPPRDP